MWDVKPCEQSGWLRFLIYIWPPGRLPGVVGQGLSMGAESCFGQPSTVLKETDKRHHDWSSSLCRLLRLQLEHSCVSSTAAHVSVIHLCCSSALSKVTFRLFRYSRDAFHKAGGGIGEKWVRSCMHRCAWIKESLKRKRIEMILLRRRIIISDEPFTEGYSQIYLSVYI